MLIRWILFICHGNFFVLCDLAAIFFCVDFSQSCRKLACQKLLNSIFPHFNFDMTQRIFSAHLLRSVLRPVGEHTIKGQLISEWIYEVIVSPKIRMKNWLDFCPVGAQDRDLVLFVGDSSQSEKHFDIKPLLVLNEKIIWEFVHFFGMRLTLFTYHWFSLILDSI